MSNIAKTFIITNFFMSVIFLGAAATLLSHHWDYKQKYSRVEEKYDKAQAGYNQQVETLQTRVKNFSNRIDEAIQKAQDLKQKNMNLTKENKKLLGRITKNDLRLENIKLKLAQINTKMEKRDDRIKEIENERDSLKIAAEDAIKAKEEALDKQQEKEILLNDLRGEIVAKNEMLKQAEKELLEAKQVIQAVKDVGVNIPSLFKKAKPIDGQIVAVSKEVPLVMISKGTHAGVKKGYKFTIYRGSTYIGQLVIEETYKNMSAARVLQNMTVKKVRKGDSVTTRIGGGGV